MHDCKASICCKLFSICSFLFKMPIVSFPIMLQPGFYFSTSGCYSCVWNNATLNKEYRHFVKAPEKKAKISFTIQATNSQKKSALRHTS